MLTSLASSASPTAPARAEWTLNENDEDVRRMVITRGLVNQSPDMYKDSFGRAYWQLPAYYALCYVTSTSNIYYQCKKRPIDRNGNQTFFGDRCFTVFMWLERLEAKLGVSEDKGLVKCELKDGRLVYVLVIAASDKPDTIPRPLFYFHERSAKPSNFTDDSGSQSNFARAERRETGIQSIVHVAHSVFQVRWTTMQNEYL